MLEQDMATGERRAGWTVIGKARRGRVGMTGIMRTAPGCGKSHANTTQIILGASFPTPSNSTLPQPIPSHPIPSHPIPSHPIPGETKEKKPHRTALADLKGLLQLADMPNPLSDDDKIRLVMIFVITQVIATYNLLPTFYIRYYLLLTTDC